MVLSRRESGKCRGTGVIKQGTAGLQLVMEKGSSCCLEDGRACASQQDQGSAVSRVSCGSEGQMVVPWVKALSRSLNPRVTRYIQ